MNVRRVPAYIDIDGEKTEIGTALIDIDMGCAEITVALPIPSELQDKLASAVSVGGVSIEDM